MKYSWFMGALVAIAALIALGVFIGSLGSSVKPSHSEAIACPRTDREFWFVEAGSGCGEPLSQVKTFTFYDGVVCDTVRPDSPDYNLTGLQCRHSK